jgi:uncharacterized caspase-like protein
MHDSVSFVQSNVFSALGEPLMQVILRICACFLAASLTITIATAQEPQRPDVQLEAEWFDGLGEAGACTTLAPEPAFLERNLTRDGVTERRVALVVGNSRYHQPEWQLANPRNDAAGVSHLLQSLGFEVYVVLDAPAQAIEDCAAKATAKPSDLSLLYYSGHGIQLEYTNYLVATDVTGLDRSLSGFVSLDKLVAGLRQSSRGLLVFLDACRNNPLPSQGPQGLAPEKVAPRALSVDGGARSGGKAGPEKKDAGAALAGGELFIAFSTSPNTTAADGSGSFSPFTASFLKHAATPGWLVQRVVAEVTKDVGEASDWGQTPWSRSSLTREIYFNGGVDPAHAQRASELKAAQSRDLLAKGERQQAIAVALQGLPENFNDDDIAKYRAAYEALYWAVRSRSLKLPVQESVHTTFSLDGTRVATVSQQVGNAGRKDALTLWSTKGERIAELLSVERSGTIGSTLGPASFSKDSRWLTHIDPVDERPIVWAADSGSVFKVLPKVPGASGMMVSPPKFDLSPSGKYVLVADASHGVRLYDASAGQTRWTKPNIQVMAISFSADERTILTADQTDSHEGGPYETVRIEGFDITDGKKLWAKEVAEETWGTYSVLESAGGKLIGVTTSADALVLYEHSTDQFHRVVIPRQGTGGFSFSPDLKYIAVSPEDQSASQPDFYILETGERVEPPLEERAALDIVYDMSGAEVGVPYFPDAGDIWRKGVAGTALFDAANAALTQELRATLANDRVRFR